MSIALSVLIIKFICLGPKLLEKSDESEDKKKDKDAENASPIDLDQEW